MTFASGKIYTFVIQPDRDGGQVNHARLLKLLGKRNGKSIAGLTLENRNFW